MKKVFQKNQIAITALAIMIAVAGYLNFTEQNASKDGNQKSGSSVETIDTMDISDGDSLIKEKAESSQNAAEKNSDEVSEESQTAGSTETIGGAVLTQAQVSEYVAGARMEREQTHSKTKESLNEIDLPAMLILDEATSSIDTRTEQKIQNAFAKMMEGRTSFIVAHRLSTIQNADVILVMQDGHIIEQGNHENLLKKNGFYANLYNSQFAN